MKHVQSPSSKLKDFFSLASTFVGTFGAIAAIVAGFFNLLTAAQLAPLAKDQAIFVERVRAIEANIPDFVSKAEFIQIDKRLDKIENKMDTLLLRK